MIFTVCLSVAGAILTMSAATGDEGKDFSAATDYLRKTIYPKLYKAVDYDPKKSFSRCPSGFAHDIDETASTNDLVVGLLYYRQGCSSDTFCEFQLDMNSHEMSMRKEGDSQYASMGQFIDSIQVDGEETGEEI